MSLSLTEFRHLCRLARLEPDLAVQDTLIAQCSDILAYMDKLSEVDTAQVEPLYSPLDHDADQACRAMRDDAALRRRTREEILAGAPETDGAFFIVPRIVETK